MAEYYLISQLPSLDGLSEGAPLPITEDRFLELCGRFLGKKAQIELEKLTLVPPILPEKSKSKLIAAWNTAERELRLALAKARANKMNKTFDLEGRLLSVELIKIATAAIETENPLDAEKFLLNHRLQLLERLRPADHFSEDYLYYYGLKLKLLLRIRQLDTQLGKTEYRKLYDSILRGDRLEATK